MTNKIYVNNSYYKITNVSFVPKQIEYDLAKWNQACFKKEAIGYYYDKDNKELRIPRGYGIDAIKFAFPDNEIINNWSNTNIRESDIHLMNYTKDYIQDNVLTFMTGHYPFEYTSKMTQLYTDLTTGYGKTYLMIATACYYAARCVVIIPAISKIANQWMESLDKFTSLRKDQYLYVHGTDMCIDIIKGKYKNVQFYIIPRSTILALVRKFNNDWEMCTRLIDAMDVSIKGIDEAHMDFNTIVNIDCFTNVPKTYYMSSSPSRSEKSEKLIYSRIFRNVPKYGKKLITTEQNYLIPVIMEFESKPSQKWLSKIKTKYGPSLSRYGDYLLDEDGARKEFLNAFIFTLYFLMKHRRNGGKILVLCITIEFAKSLKEITEKIYPYLSCGLFVGSGKSKNKELDNDIIFSTIKSMGTGSEIENHQLTINTITYSSEVMADQISGRIRKQNNRKGIYCELVNIQHPVALDHYNRREQYLIKKAKDAKLIKYNITNDDINKVANFINSGNIYNNNGLVITKNNLVLIEKRRA